MSDNEARGEQVLTGYGQTRTTATDRAIVSDAVARLGLSQTVPGKVCANPKCGVRVELIERGSVTIGFGENAETIENKAVAICLGFNCGEIRTLTCSKIKGKKIFYGRHPVVLVSEESSLCKDGRVIYKNSTLPMAGSALKT